MEYWKIIPGYENYEASSLGRVRNASTGHVMSMCKNMPDNRGYYQIKLMKKEKGTGTITRKAHTLVCLAFIGLPPDRKSTRLNSSHT